MPRLSSPSHRQLEANRLNAAKSTGPRTEEGKARSRANALKHGLTAESIILTGEDPAVVEELKDALWLQFDPATALEDHLVDQLVSILLRVKRVPAFEAALFNWMRHKDIKEEKRYNAIFLDLDEPGLHDADEADISSDEPHVGQTIAALLDKDFLSKVMRYETSLQSRLKFTLNQLHELRAHRLQEARENQSDGVPLCRQSE
jgi:hypothetical protein